MTKPFTYKGGPRDKEASEAEESDFPEIHPDGEYRWSGASHVTDSGDPQGPHPGADKATAVWHPKKSQV